MQLPPLPFLITTPRRAPSQPREDEHHSKLHRGPPSQLPTLVYGHGVPTHPLPSRRIMHTHLAFLFPTLAYPRLPSPTLRQHPIPHSKAHTPRTRQTLQIPISHIENIETSNS
ncbi:hypothetical protein K439DRAFT_1637205 [Ramaria rubella]|nr:hypothetical protein K439DRAFT_1637205 [Ramaria rubella]